MLRQLVSFISTPDQVAFAIGAALALFGVYVRLRLAHFAMHAEEQVKERRMTEDQARRRVALLTFTAPAAVVVGLAACMLVVSA